MRGSQHFDFAQSNRYTRHVRQPMAIRPQAFGSFNAALLRTRWFSTLISSSPPCHFPPVVMHDLWPWYSPWSSRYDFVRRITSSSLRSCLSTNPSDDHSYPKGQLAALCTVRLVYPVVFTQVCSFRPLGSVIGYGSSTLELTWTFLLMIHSRSLLGGCLILRSTTQ